MIKFTLSYEGNNSDDHEIDFYDVAQALIGFQRSLAITTHLVLHNEVITQAPSLRDAKIMILPPEEGSWKIMAAIGILGTGVYNLGTAPKDTPIGNLVSSAYDYVISETMGFHVDYNKTLGQQYEEINKEREVKVPIITQSQLDSVIEKCEQNVLQMHRPIFSSKTAEIAKITSKIKTEEKPFEHPLTFSTFEYIHFSEKSSEPEIISGRVSSYNINTFKGRIFLPEEKRPIPFVLTETARSASCISKITKSLTMNAKNRFIENGNVICKAYKNLSRTGRLKNLLIVEVSK